MAVCTWPAGLIAALVALATPACTPDNPMALRSPRPDDARPLMQPDPLQPMIALALADAARRSQRDVATLEVVSAEAVTWPDGSLGCPRPGMQYPQALVPGYRIRIRAGAEVLDYHAGRAGQPFHCPAGRATGPAAADPRT